MKVDLSSFDVGSYNPGNIFRITFWYFLNIFFFKSSFPYPTFFKVFLLRLFGANIGDGLVIKPCVSIKYPWFLSIGDNVWIGENVWVDNLCLVTIHSNCCISQGALLLTGNHNYKSVHFDLMVQPIILHEGSWVGAKSIVCPGVIMNPQSILTVGSVASTELLSNGIYKGCPAIKINERILN